MKKFITDKSFYRFLLSLTIPAAFQQLIQFGISMMDTVMLGRLSEIQLSASAQANQPMFVFQLFIFGLSGGGSVLAAQYWGKNDIETVRKITGIVLRITIISALALTIAVQLFPESIIGFYLKNETEKDAYIISEAIDYIKIISLGYVLHAVSMALQNIIRSVELVKISAFSNLAAFFVNVFLNWVFIFGNLGAPALGIRGAALGTLIARITDFLITFIYVLHTDKRLRFRLRYIFMKNKILLNDFYKYAIPVACNEIMWSAGISVQSAMMGNINPDVIAANSIAGVMQQLATIVIFGVAGSAAVVVGKQIGSGDKKGAGNSAFTIMIWAVILGIAGVILIIILKNRFVMLYNISDEVKTLANRLLIIVAVQILFISVSAVSIVGVLRGAGDTKFTLKLEMIALWFVAVPLGAVLGFIIKAPVLIVYAALKIDEPVKAVIAFIRTAKDSIYKDITNANVTSQMKKLQEPE